MQGTGSPGAKKGHDARGNSGLLLGAWHIAAAAPAASGKSDVWWLPAPMTAAIGNRGAWFPGGSCMQVGERTGRGSWFKLLRMCVRADPICPGREEKSFR